MTTTSPNAQPLSHSRVLTPTLRSRARHARLGIGIGVVIAIVVLISTLVSGVAKTAGAELSPTNASPTGAKALAEVLRQQGVDVRTVGTLSAATRALAGQGVTLFLVDENGYLSAKQLSTLTARAAHTVILEPTTTQLDAVAPSIHVAARVGDRELRHSGCALPAARRAGTISGGGASYRTNDRTATRCFPTARNSYSVIDVTADGRTVTVVGSASAFSNEKIIDRGNAALALGLLGDHHRLVWYLPTIGDSALDTAPTIGQLTPPWVTPVLILLLITVLAAAFWRGRRLGPLIIENLPVIVRASETMEGRARLYQKSSARLRALDALRMGTVSRLATAGGLSRRATVDEVIAAVSALTGSDPGRIRSLLLDEKPATERDLVRLSDALLELERAAATSVRPLTRPAAHPPTSPHHGE